MIVLTSTDSLQLSPTSANQVDIIASYVDTTPTSTTSSRTRTTLTAIGSASIVPAPAAGVERVIKQVSIQCVGASNSVVVFILQTATPFLMLGNNTTPLVLAQGETLHYTDTEGWRKMNSAGKIVFDVPVAAGASTPTGTGFRHITAGVEDGASKLVDTADINPLQVTDAKIAAATITNAKLAVRTANSLVGEQTGAAAVPTDIVLAAQSLILRAAANIVNAAAATNQALFRGAGDLGFASAAVGDCLRRGIGGSLGFSPIEERALGVPITANAAATAAATNLSCTGSQTMPANSNIVGSSYHLMGYFTYAHTAEATADVVAEILVNGAVVATATTNIAAIAGTVAGEVHGYLTIRTLGAGGTAMANCRVDYPLQTVNTTDGSLNTATFAIDTTVSRTLELRIRMAAGVASNTLTVTNGWIHRDL